jgi:hypothetical protein
MIPQFRTGDGKLSEPRSSPRCAGTSSPRRSVREGGRRRSRPDSDTTRKGCGILECFKHSSSMTGVGILFGRPQVEGAHAHQRNRRKQHRTRQLQVGRFGRQSDIRRAAPVVGLLLSRGERYPRGGSESDEKHSNALSIRVLPLLRQIVRQGETVSENFKAIDQRAVSGVSDHLAS